MKEQVRFLDTVSLAMMDLLIAINGREEPCNLMVCANAQHSGACMLLTLCHANSTKTFIGVLQIIIVSLSL